jgi:two-component system, chemotaxis family, chemotaxis protein CheY
MAKRILIVDDSKTLRDVVSFLLKEAGFEVAVAEDGVEALALLGNTHVDTIITDVNMPNMDGITLLKKLRALPEFKFTPILILTTENGESKQQEGKRAGATGWIVKPFVPEKFIKVVHKVCS